MKLEGTIVPCRYVIYVSSGHELTSSPVTRHPSPCHSVTPSLRHLVTPSRVCIYFVPLSTPAHRQAWLRRLRWVSAATANQVPRQARSMGPANGCGERRRLIRSKRRGGIPRAGMPFIMQCRFCGRLCTSKCSGKRKRRLLCVRVRMPRSQPRSPMWWITVLHLVGCGPASRSISGRSLFLRCTRHSEWDWFYPQYCGRKRRAN
jgi:hypothetical protein